LYQIAHLARFLWAVKDGQDGSAARTFDGMKAFAIACVVRAINVDGVIGTFTASPVGSI
jgi:hypothetical protein